MLKQHIRGAVSNKGIEMFSTLVYFHYQHKIPDLLHCHHDI